MGEWTGCGPCAVKIDDKAAVSIVATTSQVRFLEKVQMFYKDVVATRYAGIAPEMADRMVRRKAVVYFAVCNDDVQY